EIDAWTGVGAVADHVPETQHVVGAICCVGEDGAERFEVAMDVRQDGVAHVGCYDAGRSSRCTRSRMPLMNRLDSRVPNFFAISIASLITTLGGVSARQPSS